ncbi:MAG: hypothetical protein ACU843_17405 [Gammaproteobacteria bacterium]
MSENNLICREMGLGHEEFFRILPLAIEKRPWSIDHDRISIADPRGTVEIKIYPETARKIGALRLPVTVLEISFQGFECAEITKFMQRFDLGFRRGGG